MYQWSTQQIDEVRGLIGEIESPEHAASLKVRIIDGDTYEAVRDSALDAIIDQRAEPGQTSLFDKGREIVAKEVRSKKELSEEMSRRSSKPRIGLKNVPAIFAALLGGFYDPEELADEFGVIPANIMAALYGRTYSRHYLLSLATAVKSLDGTPAALSREDKDSLGRALGVAVKGWLKDRR